MKIRCIQSVPDERECTILVEELALYGIKPTVTGDTVIVEYEGRFVGTLIKVLGILDSVQTPDRTMTIQH